MEEMKINISDNLADQRARAKRVVEMWITGELATPHDAARAVAAGMADERRRANKNWIKQSMEALRLIRCGMPSDAEIILEHYIQQAHAEQEGL